MLCGSLSSFFVRPLGFSKPQIHMPRSQYMTDFSPITYENLRFAIMNYQDFRKSTPKLHRSNPDLARFRTPRLPNVSATESPGTPRTFAAKSALPIIIFRKYHIFGFLAPKTSLGVDPYVEVGKHNHADQKETDGATQQSFRAFPLKITVPIINTKPPTKC